MALVLGDENMANPAPTKISAMIITATLVFSSTKIYAMMPIPERPIPAEESLNGEILSDSFPNWGASRAMTRGWQTIISPAVWEEYP